MRKDKKTPSVTENWVRTETLDEHKKSARKTLEIAKQQESKLNCKYIKICEHPITFKRVLL